MTLYPTDVKPSIQRLTKHFLGDKQPPSQLAKDWWELEGFGWRLAFGEPTESGGAWFATDGEDEQDIVLLLHDLHVAATGSPDVAMPALGGGKLIRWLIAQILENIANGDGSLITMLIEILLKQLDD